MRNYKRFCVSLVLGLLFVAIGSHPVEAQTPLKTINNPQGGQVVYGLVDGATTRAAAMSTVLRIVHKNCGEKPQVGRVIKVRGTDSVAVFFTVVNHPQGNKPVAGMVTASPTGPNRIEAAEAHEFTAHVESGLSSTRGLGLRTLEVQPMGNGCKWGCSSSMLLSAQMTLNWRRRFRMFSNGFVPRMDWVQPRFKSITPSSCPRPRVSAALMPKES